METTYEMSFRPADELERREFESVLHDFVAFEAHKPRGESSSVFASYDAPSGRWVLSFDTYAAIKAFREHWRAHVARVDGGPPDPMFRGAQA